MRGTWACTEKKRNTVNEAKSTKALGLESSKVRSDEITQKK